MTVAHGVRWCPCGIGGRHYPGAGDCARNVEPITALDREAIEAMWVELRLRLPETDAQRTARRMAENNE